MIVIENVNVIPMTSEVVNKNQSVVVKNGKVEAICPVGTKACVVEGAAILPAGGKYLIPGLSDMHAHVNLGETDMIGSEQGKQAAAKRAQDQMLQQYLDFGVTTIRDPAGGPSNLKLRDDINSGRRMAPRLFTSWKVMDTAPKLHPATTAFNSPEEAAEFVRQTAANDYDMVKVYSNLSPEAFAAITSTAKKLNIRVAGHVPIQVDFEDALKAGVRSFEHLTGFDIACAQGEFEMTPTMLHVYQGWAFCTPDKIERLAKLTAKYEVWIDPTLIVMDELNTDYQRHTEFDEGAIKYAPASRPAVMEYLYEIFPAHSRAALQGTKSTRLGIVKALSDAGVPLLIGTDTLSSGYNVHQELALFVEAGLTPYQALRAGTVEPARYFQKEGEFGTIVKGASADFVLLDANPLDDIANALKISGVMVRGHWLGTEKSSR